MLQEACFYYTALLSYSLRFLLQHTCTFATTPRFKGIYMFNLKWINENFDSKINNLWINLFHFRMKGPKHPPRVRLWTLPILVDGPFGVVSAAEVIGIAVFVAYIVWSMYAETLQNIELLASFTVPSKERYVRFYITR